MSKAAYLQRGEALDYVNETSSTIGANTVISLAERIGIAGTDILPGETGDVHVAGVFEIKKTDSAEIAMGTTVYFDGDGITTTASSNVKAGYAAEKSAAGASVIAVKIG